MNDSSACFLNAVQAAQFLGGLNARTVTRWAREGYLPAYPALAARSRVQLTGYNSPDWQRTE
jgi:predicted site-specific integrase-resolvase